MNRNAIRLLNKANKTMKILSKRYKFVNIAINYSSIDLLLPGTNKIDALWEEVISNFIKDKINWNLRFETGNLILNIYL